MEPATPTQTPPARRLRKFIRQPELLSSRKLTDKGISAIAIIERYRFVPTSLLIRLMAGDFRNNHRHLQTLFHQGFVSRFSLPKYGGPGQFIYYLDSRKVLDILIEHRHMSAEQKPYRQKLVDYNREKNYAQIHRDEDMQGTLLYIQHELIISRFHAMLELACRKTNGVVSLEQWKQGPELKHHIEVPKVRPNGFEEGGRAKWQELSNKERLPHHPDAFFSLRFKNRPEEDQLSHFLYEADRGTETTTRFKLKLRAHYHFVVKSNLHRSVPCYNVKTIRAVLIETTRTDRADLLREAARENIVSPNPSPLFWFTSSEFFTKLYEGEEPLGRPTPRYLVEPEWVFKRVWASPATDTILNLAD